MYRTLSTRLPLRWTTVAALATIAALLLWPAAPALASVEVTDFSASGSSSGVRIRWVTASEIDHFGYNVYRTEVNTDRFPDLSDAQKVRVNAALVPASGGTSGMTYEVVDSSAADGVIYYYWLESIDSSGSRAYIGPREARRGSSGSLIGGQATATPTTQPAATPTSDADATATTTAEPTATEAATTTPPALPTATATTAVPLTAVPPTATPAPTDPAATAAPIGAQETALPATASALQPATPTPEAQPTAQAQPPDDQPPAPATDSSAEPASEITAAPTTAVAPPATAVLDQSAPAAIDVAGEGNNDDVGLSAATNGGEAEQPAPPSAGSADGAQESTAQAVAANQAAAGADNDPAAIGGDVNQPTDVGRTQQQPQQRGLAAAWLWIGLAASAMLLVGGAGALLLWLRRHS